MLCHAASFARSEGDAVHQYESFFGTSVSRTTWERRTKEFAESHAKCLSGLLKASDQIMFAFDNSQAVEKKKDQREGSLSSFWEATTEVVKALHIYSAPNDVEKMYRRPELTYVNQSIVAPLGMPPYEKALTRSKRACHYSQGS